MKVGIASEGWSERDTSMFIYASTVLTALRERTNIDARPIPISYRQSARVGGLFRSVLQQRLARYPGCFDVIHHMTASAERGVSVVTIHDLLPSGRPGIDAMVSRNQVRFSVRQARRVICHSRNVFNRMCSLFPERSEDVRFIPFPVRPMVMTRPAVPSYDALWVGGTSEHKRPLAFLDAVSALPKLTFAAVIHPLASYAKLSRDALDRAGRLKNLTIHTDFLTPERLYALYAHSSVVVSTSVEEGFHLPPMEGYLSGCKVVVPMISPYVEYYPDLESAGVFFYRREPPSELFEALLRALDSQPPNVPHPKTVELTNPSRVAAKLESVYREVFD